MAFTATSLTTTVLIGLVRACREAQRTGTSTLTNKKGTTYLTITKHTDLYNRVGFIVTDNQGNNIRQLIARAYLRNLSGFSQGVGRKWDFANFLVKRLSF